MSFPGYLKSLNLMSKNADDREPSFDTRAAHASVAGRSDDSTTKTNNEDENGETEFYEPSEGEAILDERNNPPSKSLWIGNIPTGTTGTKLRNIFNKFGNIDSTRPETKYAFVNFERIESAIAAFKAYHDMDVFHTNTGTINIRFTGSLSEAKQAREAPREKRSSMSTKAEAAQKHWFQPVDDTNHTPLPQPPAGMEWPNGPPPTGPKSQRREVSPPPLRRGDSYRPGESLRRDSYRADCDRRRSDRSDYRRGRDFRRRSDEHYSPAYSQSQSRSPSATGSSNASSRRNRSRDDKSPLPWERKKSNTQFRNLVWTKSSEKPVQNTEYRPPVIGIAENGDVQDDTLPNIDDTGKAENRLDLPPSIRLGTPDYETPSDGLSNADESISAKVMKESLTQLGLITQPTQVSKSPSLHPIERLRVEEGSNRGSSVPSEVATTSSIASTKRKKCQDCRKPASDLSPLTTCSRCSRRFHSGCGDPKPSSCLDKATFVCGRCQRRQGSTASSISIIPKTNPSSKTDGRVHLVSPPLTLTYDGTCSNNLSPRDEALSLLSDGNRLEAFFPKRVDYDETEMYASNTKTTSGPLQYSATRNPADATQNSLPATAGQSVKEDALRRKNRYKTVTCKWWALGNCTQTENDCYYAHAHTNISFPDRRRPNKAWTCYEWLQGRCACSEADCLHSHCDTGLHIWRDGRPSYKHVTCFWWLRSRCKWTSDACKFAHEDTGLYSLDPSEIWMGGQKFTTVHPADASERPSNSRRNAELSSSSTLKQNLVAHSTAQNGVTSRFDHDVYQDATKTSIDSRPSLTIDTWASQSHSGHPRNYQDIGLLLGSVGAPPQTPNEDSPSKSEMRELSAPRSCSTLLQRIPDLPTPGLDDHISPDQNGFSSTHTSFDGLPQSVLSNTASAHKAISDIDVDALEKRRDCTDNSEVNSRPNGMQKQATFLRDPEHPAQNGMSKDPRLQRQLPASKNPAPVSSNDSSPSAEMEPQAGENATTSARTEVQIGDDSIRRGVRKCLKCQKTVFGTDVCRACSSIQEVTSSDNLSDRPAPNTLPSSLQGPRLVPNDVANNAAAKETDLPSTLIKTGLTLKNPLKRSVDGSNMFLKNKRPKSSMVFSSSGSIRPDSFNRGAFTKRPLTVTLNPEIRRKPQTIEALILQEREKNKRRPSMILDASPVESPVSVGEKENNFPDSPENQPLAEVRQMDRAPIAQASSAAMTAEKINAPDTADLSSSPRQPPSKNHVSPIKSAINDSEVTQRTVEVVQRASKPQRPSHEASHWRSSESPEPQPNVAKSSLIAVRKSPELSSNQQSSTRQALPNNTVAHSKRPTLSHRLSTRDVVISSEKFTWASPITCTQCQKHHKKCLHDDSGGLNAQKCRDYVLSRKGRPDTGRSRQEWNTILKVSELDPDSDDNSSVMDDSDSESAEDAISSESEDDFATAIGGDEMEVNDISTEQEALLEKFKQPLVQSEQLSPRRDCSTDAVKLFTRETVRIRAGRVEDGKMVKLEKQGVMFESESEDEDYLSEDDKRPLRKDQPLDPLHVPLKVSRDLFDVCPELDHRRVLQEMELGRNIRPRLSRKQQWAELRSRQLQERREKFGNPHWEVTRSYDDVMVTALIQRVVPPPNAEDRLAVGFNLERDEQVSFGDFLGIPRLPELCLMNDGETLAFRDGQKERDRTFGRTGRGLGKPTTDEEKWPLRPK